MITRTVLILLLALLTVATHGQQPAPEGHQWVAPELYKTGKDYYEQGNYPFALDLLQKFRTKNLTVFLNPPESLKPMVKSVESSIAYCQAASGNADGGRRILTGSDPRRGVITGSPPSGGIIISGKDMGDRSSAVRER